MHSPPTLPAESESASNASSSHPVSATVPFITPRPHHPFLATLDWALTAEPCTDTGRDARGRQLRVGPPVAEAAAHAVEAGALAVDLACAQPLTTSPPLPDSTSPSPPPVSSFVFSLMPPPWVDLGFLGFSVAMTSDDMPPAYDLLFDDFHDDVPTLNIQPLYYTHSDIRVLPTASFNDYFSYLRQYRI